MATARYRVSKIAHELRADWLMTLCDCDAGSVSHDGRGFDMRFTTTMMVAALVGMGCGEQPDGEAAPLPTFEEAEAESQARLWGGPSGFELFFFEEFQGNGRTCGTCHLIGSGSIAPADVEWLYNYDPNHPLFASIDSDDGVGNDFTRLIEDATFRVVLDLPDNVVMDGDPSVRQVVLHRGASQTLNNPGFETAFMQDGRNATLQEQAVGAVNAHYEPGVQPTDAELDAIANFERYSLLNYSSIDLWIRAIFGIDPELPAGNTPEEIRGAAWFDNDSPTGFCAHCHGGPFLNETNQFLLAPVPPGSRFFTAFVSEFNVAGNEVHTFEFSDPNDPLAPPVVIESPDPGRALITGNALDANSFRIPTLWGVKHNAPYFHDNSAADLEEMMLHYQAYFDLLGIPMTAQDREDIIAYMNLLE